MNDKAPTINLFDIGLRVEPEITIGMVKLIKIGADAVRVVKKIVVADWNAP